MKHSKWIRTGAAGLSALAMLTFASPMAFADGSSTTWSVDVGSMTKSGIMAMSFFPNVITIDAGDAISFMGMGHTVSFPGSDGKLPAVGSPASQAPAGGTTYDGSTYTASGMMMGKPYTLTFTKPGVYPYYCLLHPGMMGVVIVNPAGTTYPMTQAQYDAQAQQEEQADFTAGQKAVDSFKVQTKQNPNGTTTYYAATDAPEAQANSFSLTSVNGSNASGSALIAFAKPPSPATNLNVTYNISVKLSGLTAGQTYTAALNEGKSGSGVAVPNSQFGNVTVNSDGSATVSGSVLASGLPQGVWNLDILNSSSQVIASGTINQPSFAYERFLPEKLTIHVGDTVVWKQTGPNEVHTVTFLPKGWKDIPNESMMPVPHGGHTYPGDGFFNSGFLTPGQTYQLTFTKPGNYQYRCLLHDVMGMYGSVDVVQRTTITSKNHGSDVAQLQRVLLHDGISPGPVDGIMGPKTSQAIRTYQKEHGLTVDGIVGPQTWASLLSISNSSSGTGSTSSQPLLHNGSHGTGVIQLQQALQRKGVSPGAIDGKFGPNTLRAVRTFQQKHGLTVDGIVGSHTWYSLLH